MIITKAHLFFPMHNRGVKYSGTLITKAVIPNKGFTKTSMKAQNASKILNGIQIHATHYQARLD